MMLSDLPNPVTMSLPRSRRHSPHTSSRNSPRTSSRILSSGRKSFLKLFSRKGRNHGPLLLKRRTRPVPISPTILAQNHVSSSAPNQTDSSDGLSHLGFHRSLSDFQLSGGISRPDDGPRLKFNDPESTLHVSDVSDDLLSGSECSNGDEKKSFPQFPTPTRTTFTSHSDRSTVLKSSQLPARVSFSTILYAVLLLFLILALKTVVGWAMSRILAILIVLSLHSLERSIENVWDSLGF